MTIKRVAIGAVVILLIAIGAYLMFKGSPAEPIDEPNGNDTTPPPAAEVKREIVIGKSVEGRDIVAYHFGAENADATKRLLLVGGTHGGYSWNASLVAFELMDYLKGNPAKIPASVQVTVIPVLNPDGLNKAAGTSGRFTKEQIATSIDTQVSSRFNANGVDLNRNFDCAWQAKGTWQSTTVSGGTAPFSEPETLALKNFVESYKPTAVVSYYSAVGGVFSSNCKNGVLPETSALTTAYATASGYKGYKTFDFYAITGDMSNWLAKSNVPAISVLLTTHDDTELSKNVAGLDALLMRYSK